MRGAELARFGAVALQFGLLVGIIRVYGIENAELGKVATLAWFGFVVHHFLPARFQLPFFALLSVASVGVALPFDAAAGVLLGGALLIALCHAPLPFAARVALALLAAGALLALRVQWIKLDTAPSFRIWPILGAMFMFRLVVYLYDLRHRAAPFSLWHAVGYFFMVPNAALPLFPVVDYKTYCRSHFNDDRYRIYQVGVRWIFRGLVHLLIYQWVYLFLVVDPAEAADASDALQYVVTTFLLYLRVSGTFHVIVGMLHLFGFNLPETHHLFFLSRSFTDFWRRINIYWKDFLTKVVFYPVYFRLKHRGEVQATVLATAVAFVTTWLLHSYQWLWLRGEFPLTARDAIFWLGLGMLVIVNLLWERKRAPKRSLAGARLTPRAALAIGLQTAGTFAALAILWTIWSTPAASLGTLLVAAGNVTPGALAALAAGLAAVGLLAVLLAGWKRENTEGTRVRAVEKPLRFWVSAVLTAAASLAVLALGRYPELVGFSPRLAETIVAIKRDKLNRIDLLGRERSYYQDLGDVFRLNVPVGGHAQSPHGWHDNAAKLLRDDFLLWEYAPSRTVEFKRAAFATNRWGMHDRDYEQGKPTGTLRIVLAGSSHEVGAGVPALATYENRAEDLLNASAKPGARYEVLNFAVEGHPPLQRLALLEQRAYAFRPDLVLYAAHANELDWVARRVAELLNRNVPVPYEEVARLYEKAGVLKGMREDEVQTKLRPHREELLRLIFVRLEAEARLHGARAAVVLVEKAEDSVRPASADAIAALARSAGLPVIDLWGAFAGIDHRGDLYLAPWDSHPGAQGHRLLGDKLHRGLVEHGLLVPAK